MIAEFSTVLLKAARKVKHARPTLELDDGDTRSAWERQRDAAILAHSKPFAERSRLDWLEARDEQLAHIRAERRNKRQALDTLRRKYEGLWEAYRRIGATTHQAWTKWGPWNDWDAFRYASYDADRWIEYRLDNEPAGDS